MKKKSVFLSVFLFLVGFLNAQNSINQAALSEQVTKDATTMVSLFKSGDYKGYLKYVHPVIIREAGGEAKMIELLKNQHAQLQSKGVVINNTVFDKPSQIVRSKDELQCTISQHTEMKPAKGRIITFTTLIAISADNGKSWKFLSTSNMDITVARKLLPNLSNKISLPPKQQPKVYNE